MMAAIHQPHYFPWLGYLAKMADADRFILLDAVQLEKSSYMIRNRVIDPDGNIRYLTLSAEKHGFLEKQYREIRTKDVPSCMGRQKDVICRAYSGCRYFDEVWDVITPVFDKEHELLCDVAIHSIDVLRSILQIDTPLVLQSSLAVDDRLKKTGLLIGLCRAVGADVYYAGRGGSMCYLDISECEREGIQVAYQDFRHPVYAQTGDHPFVPGLSALDLLFNNGIGRSREIFWDAVGTGSIG